jgi:hypothetical protein
MATLVPQDIDQHGNDGPQIFLGKIKDNFKTVFGFLSALSGGAAPTGSGLARGTFVANGATGVVVADAGVTASSIITYTLKTAGGTVGIPTTLTITPGTGFHAVSQASDTSTYNYLRMG